MLRNLLPRKRFDEFLRSETGSAVSVSPAAQASAPMTCSGGEFFPQEAEVEVLIALGQAASVMVAQQRI